MAKIGKKAGEKNNHAPSSNLYWFPESIKAIEFITNHFKKKVYLVGVRAVYERGVPIFRTTADLDIYSPLNKKERDELGRFLRKSYPKTAEYWRWFGVAYQFPDTNEKLDLGTSSSVFDDLYEKDWDEDFIKIGNFTIYIPPIEDVIVMKLVAGRSKDIGDLKRILKFTWNKLNKEKLLRKARKTGYEKKLLSFARKLKLEIPAYDNKEQVS